MTPIRETPIVRETQDTLSGTFGPDRARRLIVALKRVSGEDMIEIHPKGTRQKVMLRLLDVYRYAVQCEANREWSKRMIEKKARKAQRLADMRQRRAEKRLVSSL